MLDLSEWARRLGLGREAEDGSFEVDLSRLRRRFRSVARGRLVVDGHLSHYLPDRLLDAVVVLRLDPTRLERRLRARGYSGEKIRENLEAEALDIIWVEALRRHPRKVHQIDLTRRDLEEAIEDFLRALKRGERVVDRVDWLGRYVQRYVLRRAR